MREKPDQHRLFITRNEPGQLKTKRPKPPRRRGVTARIHPLPIVSRSGGWLLLGENFEQKLWAWQ
jgi:hypothetical protein